LSLRSHEVGVHILHDDGDGMGQQRPGLSIRLLEAWCSFAHPRLEIIVMTGDHHDPTVRPSQARGEVVLASVEPLCFGEPEHLA
jgi:hypothetical protein